MPTKSTNGGGIQRDVQNFPSGPKVLPVMGERNPRFVPNQPKPTSALSRLGMPRENGPIRVYQSNGPKNLPDVHHDHGLPPKAMADGLNKTAASKPTTERHDGSKALTPEG